jgi:hypothetical protein
MERVLLIRLCRLFMELFVVVSLLLFCCCCPCCSICNKLQIHVHCDVPLFSSTQVMFDISCLLEVFTYHYESCLL